MDEHECARKEGFNIRYELMQPIPLKMEVETHIEIDGNQSAQAMVLPSVCSL